MNTVPHAPGQPGLSLVKRLSRTLTLAIITVWLLCTGIVAWYVNRQIQHNFDLELIESAHRQLYPALLDLWPTHRLDLPPSLDGIRADALVGEPRIMGEVPGSGHPEPLLLQLRDANGQVLLRTQSTPRAPFAVPLEQGFFDTPDFRVFTLYDPQYKVWLQLADPLEERLEAADRTLYGLLAVLFVMLPVLVWLIHWIAQRELRSVEQLKRQIAARSSSNLQTVDLSDLPLELHAVGRDVNQLLERLADALNAERSLAANAAHELRTPLADIRLRLHTAIDRAVNDSTAPTATVPVTEVKAVLQSLESLSHRTERLLQLSRAEGRDNVHFHSVNLVQLAEQMAQEFWQKPAFSKRLDLLLPEDSAAVWVRGDLDGLAIVLRNLLDNALHHTQAAVELQVRAGAQPALLVRDHGPGLNADQREQILQRHARLGSQHMGYGLGMSIVRSIVEKHAAQLTLASPAPGQTQGLEIQIVFDQPAPAP